MGTPERVLSNEYYGGLKGRGAEIEERFRTLSATSGELFERARGLFPGGFTRAAIIRKPYAPFMARGKGAVVTDVS